MNRVIAEFGNGERFDLGEVKSRQEMIERAKNLENRGRRAIFVSGQTKDGKHIQAFIDSADQVFNDVPLIDEEWN
jgi:biotin synthase-like enzyme